MRRAEGRCEYDWKPGHLNITLISDPSQLKPGEGQSGERKERRSGRDGSCGGSGERMAKIKSRGTETPQHHEEITCKQAGAERGEGEMRGEKDGAR